MTARPEAQATPGKEPEMTMTQHSTPVYSITLDLMTAHRDHYHPEWMQRRGFWRGPFSETLRHDPHALVLDGVVRPGMTWYTLDRAAWARIYGDLTGRLPR